MCHRRTSHQYFAAGFSLLEFAIVIAIFAMLVGSLLVPLGKQIEQQRYAETERILASARDALVSYAAANGRLPCPAINSSVGVEAFAAGGTKANGLCAKFDEGYLPAATLGFTPVDDQSFAVDAWGLIKNRIRYAVSNATILSIPQVFTTADGIKNAAANAIELVSSSNAFLYVCSDKPNPLTGPGCGTDAGGNPITPLAKGTAIAVIYSVGANAADTPSATEGVNYFDDVTSRTSTLFVSRTHRSSGEVFDDVVTWIGPNLLIGRMIAAGRLP